MQQQVHIGQHRIRAPFFCCEMSYFLPPGLFEEFMHRHVGALPVAQQVAVSLVSKRFSEAAARRCRALHELRNTAPAYRQDEQSKAACEMIRALGSGSLSFVRWLHERLRFKLNAEWCNAAAEGTMLMKANTWEG